MSGIFQTRRAGTQLASVSTMSRDLPTALHKLAIFRSQNTRASQDVFEQGLLVLDADAFWKQGDDGEVRLV